ncbi:MAG: hypothetical protein K8F92_19095 [Hyphomicrobium sp.]|uniref:hypothetical protein n=1 Tax=Hyphomicrobium sp. TaxID=82 RepID=UPI001321BDB7|nr:hypothetical protein [Hyphomicrobium sp.]KAB2938585.1 MAG: hypothetical protein F9K20_18700 [Hyphomicrobium sp.]MBZ0211739.1 hypothetical protein [Hyphomicrobium sp.]
MPSMVEGRWVGLPVLVLAVVGLVHAAPASALERRAANEQLQTPPASVKRLPKPGEDTGPLPAPVEEMRQAILAAAHSGNIEDLREPLDWNELKPEVAAAPGEDPIAYWKRTSGDGNGREILAVLADILPMRAAELPLGKDLENNIIYVWPYLAEMELDKLTPAQEVDLLRLVGPAEAKAMREKKKWTWWRLTIGADGTWHSFKKAE